MPRTLVYTYCLNQEKHLRVFLDYGKVPAANNAVDGAIRVFCIEKENWHLIDTIDGAKVCSLIYNISETAKVNFLKPDNYF